MLTDKKEEIEKLALKLLENEVLNLPDIVAIMGKRPFPMKETVREYLEELKEREVVEANLAEEVFNKWLETEKASLETHEKDSEESVAAKKAFEAVETEISESIEKGENVSKYGKRIMDRAE